MIHSSRPIFFFRRFIYNLVASYSIFFSFLILSHHPKKFPRIIVLYKANCPDSLQNGSNQAQIHFV